MPKEKNIPQFTAVDIEKYHKGLLTPAEMNAMEKAALEDPFLADAMEGFTVQGVHAAKDIAELHQRLADRTTQSKILPIGTKTKKIPWLKIAAMLIFIAGAGFLVYQLGFFNQQGQIAKTESAKTDNSSPEKAMRTDSVVQHQPPTASTKQENTTPGIDKSKSNKKPRTKDAFQLNPSAPAIVTAKKPDANAKDKMAVIAAEPAPAPAAIEKKEVVLNNDEAMKKISEKKRSVAKTRALTLADKNILAGKTENKNTYYLSGRVVDKALRGIPFANIQNLENRASTYSDAKGYFNIPATDSINDILVRSVGFAENKARIKDVQKQPQIILQEVPATKDRFQDMKRRSVLARSNNAALNTRESIPVAGWDNYDNYLANNIQLPASYQKETDAEVMLSFTVNKSGMPENIIIEKSVSADCDREAVRLLSTGPKWTFINENLRTTISIPF